MEKYNATRTPSQVLKEIAEKAWKEKIKERLKLPINKVAIQSRLAQEIEDPEKLAEKCLGCCFGDVTLCRQAVVLHLSLQATAAVLVLLFALLWFVLFKRFVADRKEIQTRYANEDAENEVVSFPTVPFSRVDPITFVPVLPCDTHKFPEMYDYHSDTNCTAAVHQDAAELYSSSSISVSDFVIQWMAEYRAHRSCLDDQESQFVRVRSDSAGSHLKRLF